MPQPEPNALFHRPEIDGLRALAVLPVIFFHSGFSFFSGGFVGVDIFFVISGYLISRIIFNETSTSNFSLKKFYERRARRILPALLVMVFACLPCAWLWMAPGQMRSFSKSVVALSVFASNIQFYRESGYFDALANEKPLLHTWSLAVEEQFYLFFPLVLVALSALDEKKKNLCLVLFALCSLGLSEYLWRTNPDANFYLMPSRAFELLAGALLAIQHMKNTSHSSSVPSVAKNIFGIIGLGMLFVSFAWYRETTPFPSLYALLPLLGTVLILDNAQYNTFAGKFLSSKPLVGIGLISYSAYLWHQPLLAFARIRSFDEPSIVLRLVLVAVTFIIAYLSWRYVEKPFRDQNFLSRRTIFLLAIIGSMLLFGIGTYGFLSGGFVRLRFTPAERVLIEPERSDGAQQQDACFLLNHSTTYELFQKNSCVKIADKKFNVLLIGDSHAASLYPALFSFLEQKNTHLSQLTSAFCLPLVTNFPPNTSRTATKRCADINTAVLKTVVEQPFDLIVFSAYLHQWGFTHDDVWSYPNYLVDFEEALDRLRSTEKKILIVGEFPIWKKPLPDILSHELLLSTSAGPVADRSWTGVERTALTTDAQLIQLAARHTIPYESLINHFCTTQGCRRFVPSPWGNTAISFDYGHLSRYAANYVVEQFVGPRIISIIKPHDKAKP